MDGARLHSILIENFRSIDKKVEVRLDAAVVLVQGPNGVGKTSLLSGIELALTGAVPSMLRADPKYTEQLLHYGASAGKIILDLRNVSGVSAPLEVKLTPNGMTRSGILEAKHTRFFSERCYLAQSALTQLLTIYQEANGGVESLLSRFVSELLGLDRLDALELGLEPARDRRNARKLAPSYADVEQESSRLTGILRDRRAEFDRVRGDVEYIRKGLQAPLLLLDKQMPQGDQGLSVLERELNSESEEGALVDLADRRRQLSALRREHERQVQVSLFDQSAASAGYRSAQQDLAAWRGRFANDITRAFAAVSPFFPNADWTADIAPGRSVANAIVVTAAEIKRLEDAEARLTGGARRIVEIDEALRRNVARIAELDQEVAAIAAEVGPLSQILSELISHIHDEECPVCGRDYSEVSKEPLASRGAKQEFG
jgi:DNA repair protein SbcC/Rad50